jgi:SAM-dependent methyltransferase
MSITSEDVRNAYRFILGREPESEDVIRTQRDAHRSVTDLRAAFLQSAEFRNQFPSGGPFLAFDPIPDVEVETDAASLNAMVDRTASCWTKAGATEPYWSVLGERYLSSEWSKNRDEFYRSGYGDRDFVVALLARVGRSPKDVASVVEFGCGVGRCTIPLARTFARVIGVDVSPNHLQLARQYANAEGLTNIELLQATSSDIMPARDYDLWFSRLVLQHNPPPVIGATLKETFRRLNPKGVAVIHIPTYRRGYSFHIDEYLDDKRPPGVETHSMPAPLLLEIARNNNCWLMDIHEEPGHKDEIHHIFTFGKN